MTEESDDFYMEEIGNYTFYERKVELRKQNGKPVIKLTIVEEGEGEKIKGFHSYKMPCTYPIHRAPVTISELKTLLQDCIDKGLRKSELVIKEIIQKRNLHL